MLKQWICCLLPELLIGVIDWAGKEKDGQKGEAFFCFLPLDVCRLEVVLTYNAPLIKNFNLFLLLCAFYLHLTDYCSFGLAYITLDDVNVNMT